jgi:hypothetical protein
MRDPASVSFRPAGRDDARAVAELHAFLDNLHVAYGLKQRGIGTRLLTLTRQAVRDWSLSASDWIPSAAELAEIDQIVPPPRPAG